MIRYHAGMISTVTGFPTTPARAQVLEVRLERLHEIEDGFKCTPERLAEAFNTGVVTTVWVAERIHRDNNVRWWKFPKDDGTMETVSNYDTAALVTALRRAQHFMFLAGV